MGLAVWDGFTVGQYRSFNGMQSFIQSLLSSKLSFVLLNDAFRQTFFPFFVTF
jgi:hypothetical protein